MKLLLETIMILLGTLLAAAIVALGEPAHSAAENANALAPAAQMVSVLGSK